MPSRNDRGEAAEDGAAHIDPRVPVLAVPEQSDALVTEGAHGREGAAEPDGQATAQVRREDGGPGREAHDEAEQKRPGDVDRQSARRERPAAGLDRALQ